MKRLTLLALLVAAPLHAQSAGKTGAQVLQFNAGARAAGLAGAYSGARGDADLLFYNPAGIAGAQHGASAAYETYAGDVAFGSAAAFTHVRRFSVGLSISYLDAGSIQEIVPNQDFGGNTGTPTGNSVGASETAARLSIAAPMGAKLRLGVSAGYVTSSIAEASQNAPMADVGAQYDIGRITLSAALRNVGGSLSGTSDPLPTEARLGALVPLNVGTGIGVNLFGDAIARLRESSLGFVGGIEAGLMPRNAAEIGAVARIGFDTESHQLAALRFGAGITVRTVTLDYAYQNQQFLGAVHRLGLRWSVR